jgi:hypothetical protein
MRMMNTKNSPISHFKAILGLIYVIVVLSIQNVIERLKWAVNRF